MTGPHIKKNVDLEWSNVELLLSNIIIIPNNIINISHSLGPFKKCKYNKNKKKLTKSSAIMNTIFGLDTLHDITDKLIASNQNTILSSPISVNLI